MATKNWQGSVKLDYAYQDQHTQIVSAFSEAPLKVQRPFYPELNGACHTVLVHTAGGMVAGDRLDMDITLQPQAHALITTSAAGKAYRSESKPCLQQIQIEVKQGGICEWVPQETILFEASAFQQQLRVNLASDAIWMGMELFRFGRTARGEMFQSGDWRSHTEVWRDNTPLWIDRSMLNGHMRSLPNTLGNAVVMGTLIVVGQVFEPEAIAEIRQSCPIPESVNLGISRLHQGVICRYLGASTTEAKTHFLKIWESLRKIYAGCDICIPRVWQI